VGSLQRPESAEPAPNERPYAGPPRSEPPPRGWRTPTVADPLPPRPLPPQDHDALDAEDQEALRFTYGLGLLAGGIMLVLLFVACARLLG
jgi:hypothetical protein